MNELGTVAFNQKRSFSPERSASPKRIKSDSLDTDESDDFEESNSDANNTDDEDDSTVSTDQSRYYPTVSHVQSSFNRHSKHSIKTFRYLHDHSNRKPIEPTKSSDENFRPMKKLRISFNRLDLLKEGHAILSDQFFPFYSLCYLCGSIGNDLIYCNNCCQAYHRACLNESERPRLCPTPESWLCPNCNVCHICGLLGNSLLITCSDCQRIFHIKCLKSSRDEQQYLNLRSQLWFCPLCIKCDCGQKLISNETNLLSITKSLSSQQSLMCTDCLNNMKIIRTNKNDKIEKCHLCEKFIEQFITKPKPLFSLSLIGNQPKPKVNYLLQCHQCQHRFHPMCDGYLNEDVTLISHIPIKIICSKCDADEQRDNVRKSLINYKLQVVKNTISSIASTLQIIISEETRLNDMTHYLSNLQELHQSRNQSLNLHAFINDLLIIVQRLLDNLDSRQWQAAIDNCLANHCPWFKFSHLYSTNKILLCPSMNPSMNPSNLFANRCSVLPSIDHTYSLNNERILFQSNVYKNNLLTSSDSLLRYMNNQQTNSFENFHQIDTRICQLCQTYADHFSPNISRLISIGVNQWVHIGCILPAYSKTLDQPPYILHNINETIHRCQTKSKCEICHEMNASVQCYVNDCQARFHCQCIDSLLPNLTALCSVHSRKKDEINLMKIKSLNLSSPVYVDLSDSLVEFSLSNIKLCIGSLQIKSLGNFDYLLEHDPNTTAYPNGYVASRLFWSTKNARQKTIYHLQIKIEQTYHHEKCNHQTIEYPLSSKQIHLEELYQTCDMYFKKFQNKSSFISSKKLSLDTKTLRSLLNNHSSDKLSRVALAIVQALQHPSTKLYKHEPICHDDVEASTDQIIELYQQWLRSKFGRIQFTITSDDGYKIISDNLDEAWSTIVNLVRECRDDMNLTHFAMSNEELNGHQIFGLTKSMIKQMFNQEQTDPMILSNSNCLAKKKSHSKKVLTSNSRLNVYQRKSSQRQRFNWLLNPNRKIEYALNTFEIDPALDYARQILLDESSVNLRLYYLRYFSQRVLLVGSSSIHGCGLFTLIDLMEGQMIIEYTGEVIRPCLTDKRERENEKKGFGCYMFTVDSMNVIDATHQGNKARFINHHCQPNCFAKTVISGGVKHIVIYALKNILRGSELTYDYSFPEEDIKIPCHCGTSNCRIYLN